MISERIRQLLQYGIEQELIQPEDVVYTRNRLLEILKQEEYEECDADKAELEDILSGMLTFAGEQGLIDAESIVERDLFDTKLMGCLTPAPSQVISKFNKLYEESPEKATEYFYNLCRACDYIRTYRIKKDMRWKTDTEYGELDITINLSKPEKDPKAIAAARLAKPSGYPKCMLCRENEGYAGRMNHPARQNLRMIPLKIAGKDWFFQYSPYVYYNEHCIVLCGEHTPMKLNRETFKKLFDFINIFPHYFIGSNADLPIVGGSILSHDHYQGGNYCFAMEKAETEKNFSIPGFEDVEAGILHWPLSVIRIRSKDAERLIDLADHILQTWREYTDEEAFVYAYTDGEAHNTITPIARKNKDMYELDLALRNNMTTEEFPLGVYHPHQKLHHIKKENIGLIEVMGLAVLPARLKQEMQELAESIVTGASIREQENISKHADWVEEFLPAYEQVTEENIMDILKHEIGIVYKEVLEDAGVFKCTKKGRADFDKFISTL